MCAGLVGEDGVVVKYRRDQSAGSWRTSGGVVQLYGMLCITYLLTSTHLMSLLVVNDGISAGGSELVVCGSGWPGRASGVGLCLVGWLLKNSAQLWLACCWISNGVGVRVSGWPPYNCVGLQVAGC